MNRLINRKVARVVIGMLDPDERIRGRGILALRKANIRVDLFPPELMSELEEMNREFIHEREKAGKLDGTRHDGVPAKEIYAPSARPNSEVKEARERLLSLARTSAVASESTSEEQTVTLTLETPLEVEAALGLQEEGRATVSGKECKIVVRQTVSSKSSEEASKA